MTDDTPLPIQSEASNLAPPEGDPVAAAAAILRRANQLKKPTDWQDFQARCVVLFQDELGDPHCKEYGRGGQDQGGIDILGRRNGAYVGVQCRLIAKPIKKKKIEDDVAEAVKLPFAFSEIIFATTAPDDTHATNAAHEVEQAFRAKGYNFRIEVYGWQALQQLIARHPRASAWFNPDTAQTPDAKSLDVRLGRIESSLDRMGEVVSSSNKVAQPSTVDDYQGEDAVLHSKIDAFRDLNRDGEALLAKNRLLELLKAVDPAKTPYAFYRIKSNLASSAHELGAYQEASELWIEAYNLRKHDPKAIASYGLARLTLSEPKEAMKLAETALALDPKCELAVNVWLQAAARTEWEGDPVAIIPSELIGKDQIDAGLLEFKRIRNDTGWYELSQELSKKHSDPYFQQTAALATLERVVGTGLYVNPASMSVTPEELRAAATQLKENFERKAHQVIEPNELAAIANNAALALRISGKYSEAIGVIQTAEAKGAKATYLTRLLGILQALNGDIEQGMNTLASIPADGEAQLARAEMMADGDRKSALALVKSIPPEGLSAPNLGSRALLICELGLREKDRESFEFGYAALQTAAPGEDGALVELLGLEGRVKFSSLPVGEAISQLLTISSSLAQSVSIVARLAIAQTLGAWGQSTAASRVLDGHIDLQRPNQATIMYLQSLGAARRDTAFAEAIDASSDEVRDNIDVLWLRAAHAWNRGDLTLADELTARLVEREPKSLRNLIFRIDVLFRLDKTAELRDLLDQPIENLETRRTADQYRLVGILRHFGNLERATALSYRVFLEHRDEPRAWMTLMGNVLSTGESEERTALFQRDKVADDAAVDFTTSDGQASFVVIEPSAELRALDSDAIEPEHVLAQAMMGLAIGDVFELADGSLGEIANIRHKVIARFQSMIGKYESRFPAQTDLRSISVNPGAEDGLQELLEKVKEQHDFAMEEARNYRDNKVPLALQAQRVGVDVIDAAIGIAEVGIPIHVCVGTHEERNTAVQSIRLNAQSGCVLDAFSFWICHRLGILDLIQARLGKIHLARKTVDLLMDRRTKLQQADHDGFRSMGYRDGKLAMTEMSREAVDNVAEQVESAIAWANAFAEILPVEVPDDLPEGYRHLLTRGRVDLLDEIFIARSSKLILVSDDLPIRVIAKSLGVNKSTWTQAVLLDAAESKAIDDVRYAHYLSQMIEARHAVMGVSVNVLVAALGEDADTRATAPGKKFRTIASALGGKAADLESHVRVTLGTIFNIWSDGKFERLREAATGILLECVIQQRADYRLLLEAIESFVARNRRLSRYLQDWMIGHFVADPTPTRETRAERRRRGKRG